MPKQLPKKKKRAASFPSQLKKGTCWKVEVVAGVYFVKILKEPYLSANPKLSSKRIDVQWILLQLWDGSGIITRARKVVGFYVGPPGKWSSLPKIQFKALWVLAENGTRG